MMLLFHDPDAQDFYEAFQASLLGREPTIHEAYGAGWNAAVRHMAEVRKFEEEQYRRSCED
jgi:hypothetical protein